MKYYTNEKEITLEEAKKIEEENQKYLNSDNFEDLLKCKFIIKESWMKTTKEINKNWSAYDQRIAKLRLENYGLIYLDEYDQPMMIEDVENLYY